jgi:DinB superfamily
MQQTAQHIRDIVAVALPALNAIDNQTASQKPLPEKWSKKEILGHLIDSACNNQQKFVRTMAQPHLDFVGYAQNHWVNAQKYNLAKWQDLVLTWQGYNLQIAHIIENVDSQILANTISIEGVGPFTLEFIMKDYAEHLKHHLKQITPDIELTSGFVNVYGA